MQEKHYTLEEIVDHARSHSPFYRELYKDVSESGWKITDLPVVNQDDFWAANSSTGENTVLTMRGEDGIVFKSGGTTGSPKHSVFGRNEWLGMCEEFARHLVRVNLCDGDRVANLFYSGNLYASFLFSYHALATTSAKIVQYPLAGSASDEFVIETIKEFNINVLMGIPATLMRLIELIAVENDPAIKIDKLFFAGETLYEDQRKHARSVFPDIEFHSCGYASVDGGFIATADSDCGFNEHLTIPNGCVTEIIDPDTDEVIDEIGVPGILVASNLTRKQMPIIRYPLGDYGEWLEEKKNVTQPRKFRLLGRSEAGARVGPATVYITDITDMLNMFSGKVGVSNFQLHITREAGLDKLNILFAVRDIPDHSGKLAEEIIAKLLDERKMLAELIEQKIIQPVIVTWVAPGEIKSNPRTGKCLRVIDDRLKGESK